MKDSLVSVVVACYNKKKYIGELLESVLAQTWKHIQIVLIDDGSTDETAAVIEQYEKKFLAAGMEFIFLKQVNMGVALAVRNGLAKATGEFVCMPDADDELLPGYIEQMVCYLQEHEDVKWCVCDSDRTRWTQCVNEYTDVICSSEKFPDLLERYLLMRHAGMVWQLMIRMEYLHRTKILECLSLMGWTTTHESQVWIPIILGGGKGIYLPRKLYIFRDTTGSLSNPGNIEKVLGYSRRYREAIVRTLEYCGVSDEKYYFFGMLREYIEILSHAPGLREWLCWTLSDILQRGGHIKRPIDPNSIVSEGNSPQYHFCCWLWNRFLPSIGAIPHLPKGRVFAYGVLGKRAARMLPGFNESNWMPCQLWDQNGGNALVTKPNFGSLEDGDTVLVFPASDTVLSYVRNNVEKNVNLIHGIELNMLYRRLQYLQFPILRFDGSFQVVS